MSEFLSNLYTFKGRIGRLGFIWNYIVIMVLVGFFTLVMTFVTAVVELSTRAKLNQRKLKNFLSQ